MGIECYQIILKVEAEKDKLESVLGSLSAEPAYIGRPDAIAYLYVKEKHILEVAAYKFEHNRCIVSIRFSLCQPQTIDYVFLDFLKYLNKSLIFQLIIVESEGKEINTINEELIIRSINAKRILWKSEFGNKTDFLTCNDSLKKITEGYFL